MGGTVFILGEAERWKNYRRAVESAGGRVLFGPDPASAAAADALLLPGGGDLEPWRYGQEDRACRSLDPERDAAEFALLDRFVTAGKPVLGICRGLQTVNVYFGGTLVQDVPGHSALNGADRLHGIRTAPSPMPELFETESGGGVVNSAHHQAADRLGAGLEAVQWAPDGVVEALVHWTKPVWAVQWHPERLEIGQAGGALFRAFLALLD